MAYQVALAPDLRVLPADFAADWNADPRCRAVAEAVFSPSRATHFDPVLIGGAIALISSIGVNVASNALYDLINSTFR